MPYRCRYRFHCQSRCCCCHCCFLQMARPVRQEAVPLLQCCDRCVVNPRSATHMHEIPTIVRSGVKVAISIAVAVSEVVIPVAAAVKVSQVAVPVAIAVEVTPTQRNDCRVSRQLTSRGLIRTACTAAKRRRTEKELSSCMIQARLMCICESTMAIRLGAGDSALTCSGYRFRYHSGSPCAVHRISIRQPCQKTAGRSQPCWHASDALSHAVGF